jgi:hypothetical protein
MTEQLPVKPDEEQEQPLYFRADQRQKERLTEIPALYRTNHERLACELALKMDPAEEVFARYGYTPEAAMALMESPAFTALLGRIGVEIRENGLSFRQKAKAIAEELLPTAFDIATDPLQSSAVRADLIKWAAKVAGHEPNPKEAAQAGAGFTLNLTFAGQTPEKIVGHVPLTLENGEGQ